VEVLTRVFFTLALRYRRVVTFTYSLIPGERRLGSCCIDAIVGPRAGLGAVAKTKPSCRELNTTRPAFISEGISRMVSYNNQ